MLYSMSRKCGGDLTQAVNLGSGAIMFVAGLYIAAAAILAVLAVVAVVFLVCLGVELYQRLQARRWRKPVKARRPQLDAEAQAHRARMTALLGYDPYA
jgi:type VI protein secretion system component VasK